VGVFLTVHLRLGIIVGAIVNKAYFKELSRKTQMTQCDPRAWIELIIAK
jgi:hypothetical protein